jgi:antitoxin VapB
MALNIKDPEVDRLATEVAAMTGETKTAAVRKALEERRERLALRRDQRDRETRLASFLERFWASVPPAELGRRLTKEEEEAILGFGPEGA